MVRKIIKYPDPLLARRAREIDEITPEVRALAEDMLETMYEADGIGLAAPQVGQSVRLVVLDVSGPAKREEPLVLVNPVITSQEGRMTSDEGCLSVADYRANVTRCSQCTVQALDLDGNKVTVEGEELKAVCLQHELDHLDGVLFIDHVSRLKRSMYDKKVKKWIKQGREL